MREEIKNHLTEGIIPFWKGMRDDEFGGYYGYLDYDLNLDKKAEKGCILNSRITWFFSNAYTLLKDESLLDEAKHGYAGQKCHEGEEYQAEILNNDPDDSACAVMFVVSFHLCHFTLPPSSIFSLF